MFCPQKNDDDNLAILPFWIDFRRADYNSVVADRCLFGNHTRRLNWARIYQCSTSIHQIGYSNKVLAILADFEITLLYQHRRDIVTTSKELYLATLDRLLPFVQNPITLVAGSRGRYLAIVLSNLVVAIRWMLWHR